MGISVYLEGVLAQCSATNAVTVLMQAHCLKVGDGEKKTEGAGSNVPRIFEGGLSCLATISF